MRLTTNHRWWAILAAAATSSIILWLYLPPLPKAHPIPSPNPRLLPYRYWNHRQSHPTAYLEDTCMALPALDDIHYAAPTWQLLVVENGSIYVYGAYWDDRFDENLVRILVYTDVTPLPKLYCQLWYPYDNTPQLEVVSAAYAWRPAWGGPLSGVNEPYILTCGAQRHPPEPELAPVAVSVVVEPCGVATNVLNIQNAPLKHPLDSDQQEVTTRNTTSIAVCLKWLHFRQDVSVRLIEWMQLLQHFGAEKVYIYVVRVHHNTRKVLNHYQSSGFADVTELCHPPQTSGLHLSKDMRDFVDMRRELLTLNDCLFRSLGSHDWLAVIDLDEIIVSDTADTWLELLAQEISSAGTSGSLPFDALVFPHYYVLEGMQRDLRAPAWAPIMSQTWRSAAPSTPGWHVKSFINTSSVTAMHNHTPLSCQRQCRQRWVDPAAGKLLHYRQTCREEVCSDDVVRDDTVKRWREEVLEEVNGVLKELGLGKWMVDVGELLH